VEGTQVQDKKYATGRVQADGTNPMTWVEDDEPAFATLASMYEKRTGNPARPHGSKYGMGQGFFFPTELYDSYMRLRVVS
jgi:hypothetical protein